MKKYYATLVVQFQAKDEKHAQLIADRCVNKVYIVDGVTDTWYDSIEEDNGTVEGNAT